MNSSPRNHNSQTLMFAALVLATCLFGLLLAGCSASAVNTSTTIVPRVESTHEAPPAVATEPVSTAAPSLTPTSNYTPTPDTRPLPEDWHAWPIIPTLSPWLVDIYEEGLAQGNDPHHFSVAGDCQNIPQAFMGLYDNQDRVSFAEDEQYLRETVEYFSGSWSRDGLAVDGGFNFPAVFSPLRADAEICDPNEDPLACEIRTHKPAFIFISMEFVYVGRTAENYDVYLRQAVDYALEQKVIPILLTKADNVEGGHVINSATALVAYDYDIPLINWWLAAQPLEGHGIDWDRDANAQPQGFHITEEQGWSTRSYLGIKTLDTFLRTLQEQGAGG